LQRAANDGACHAPAPTPEEVERRRAIADTFDTKKMRERLRELSGQRASRTNLRLVARLSVRGRRGRASCRSTARRSAVRARIRPTTTALSARIDEAAAA
jgi:hypothetical protein